MSEDERIALLEALLARVLSRSRAVLSAPALAGAPIQGSSAAPSTTAPATPPPIRPKYSGRPELPAGLFATSQPNSFPTLLDSDRWSPPTPPPEPRVRNGSHAAPAGPPPMEVVELEVDPEPAFTPAPRVPPESRDVAEPPAVPPPLESRSRLVAASPAPEARDDDGAFDEDDEPSLAPPASAPSLVASDPTIADAERVRPIDAATAEASLEAIEATPSSSRRPISLETKMNEPDDDVAPLHSPPPKSGPLPAALPTFDLSMEPIESEASSVNVVTRVNGTVPAPEESRPSVVRTEMNARQDVALIVPPARPTPAAKTFGELLDEAFDL